MDRQLKRLMLALALTCAIGWLFKAQCGAGWTHSVQYTSGCYSDAVPFWGGRGVAAGEVPYFQARIEYPVLAGALIWLDGGVTRALFGSEALATHFLFVTTLFNALLAALVLWMLFRAGMDMKRLWGWALAPPLILYVGHNWDMLAVALAVAAALLAREGRLAKAAATAGLGMAAKLFPMLLLPLIGLSTLFRPGASWAERIRRSAIVTASAIAAWAVVNLPVALFAPANWAEFYSFSSARSGTAAAVWEILGTSGTWVTSTAERNLWSALAFVAGAAAIIGLGWRQHRERLWVLFTPLLAWFMLTNKVYSPQFDLWLYPLLLMTAPRLRPIALFVAGDIAAYFAEFWWFAAQEVAWPAATQADIALAAGVRAVAMLWLIADMVRLPAPDWISRTDGPRAGTSEA